MNQTKSENNPAYSSLVVIDELRVGPVRIETKRVVAPYSVTIGETTATMDFIYSYEEKVFDAVDPADQNLACMMAAQPALNYGLFCRRIVFDGLFDQSDHRFLREMLENTSREIYVKKFLEPNEFLVGEQAQMKTEKRSVYTNARIEFINTSFPTGRLSNVQWATDQARHCVLSSGGKDSMLTYSMLKELGKEAHPVFGNESGRHWFTAVNGYRYIKERDPNTTKVWMNSDRLFAWMLRHIPFIRQDFANVRSDDYPIRLWTVAVFIFGALPLMKKRKIGRLAIGNEYDSTQKSNHEGITHYNGYYDQSRYFDEMMSRYYLKKGWEISQFSVLRPLSELLIMKILVNRYPEIQKNQVSCHAVHERDGRMFPCGKCEKCRRIVGMMSALGADPRRCGYDDEQISRCLEGLATKKVNQLGADAGHLQYLLHIKGLIRLDEDSTGKLRPRPQVMKLRFDRERSFIEGIPVDLRQPLYELMLEYADGSVMMHNRQWTDFDVLQHPKIKTPYFFELDHPEAEKAASDGSAGALADKYQWATLTWKEAERRLQETDIALLPVGAIEQHGPHLPLDTDAFDADYLAHRVARACSLPRPLVLPLVPYGVSYHHDDFKGTISISNEAMARFIYDIGMSAARNGIRKLIIINGHGDNAPTLNYAAQMINRDARIFVCVDTGETSDADINTLTETHNDIHAGEIETSTTLAVRPELVKMDKAVDETLLFSNRYLDFSSENSVPWYVHTKKISESGIMGNPTLANAVKGRRIWKIMIAHLAALVEELKEMTLEEIYQKRY
jgi:creatinine amidohydrolase/Fe(II)-dependent formamide hydrolase-like protein